MKEKSDLGIHIVANYYGVDSSLLEYISRVRDILFKAANNTDLTVVGESFHQFEPVGVTGVLVLSESHLSIHTWPEKNAAAIDVFTCGNEGNADEAIKILQELFKPEKTEIKKIVR